MMAFVSFKTLSLLTYALDLAAAAAMPVSTISRPHNATLHKRSGSEGWVPGNAYWYASNEPFINFEGGYDGEEISFWFQLDGNFVVYSTGGVAQWNSNTGGHSCTAGDPACMLTYQSDGNFVIYIDGSAVWSTGTNANSANGNTESQLMVLSNGEAGQNYPQTFDSNDSPFVLILGPYYGEAQTEVMWASEAAYHDGDPGSGTGIPNGGAPISGVPVTYGGDPNCSYRRDLMGRC